MTLRDNVDSAINRLQIAAKFVTDSDAPLDTHGGHPGPSLLSRSLNDIKDAVDGGPPLTLSDVVSACVPCTFT